jgi:hypothetical protein
MNEKFLKKKGQAETHVRIHENMHNTHSNAPILHTQNHTQPHPVLKDLNILILKYSTNFYVKNESIS